MLTQKANLGDEDLAVGVAELQQWLVGMDANMAELRRKLGVNDRNILSKKQLIEANKAQYTRVSKA